MKYPFVKLVKFCKDISDQREVIVKDDDEIREPTLRTKTHKLEVKNIFKGSDIRIKRRVKILKGDFIFAKLHTQNGAFAIADCEFITTNTFMPVEINNTLCDKQYLFWALEKFIKDLQVLNDTVGRETYKSQDILNLEIPLPPLPEQQRIVAKLETLSAKIEEARALRQQTAKQIESLFAAKLQATIKECGNKVRCLPFTDLARLERRPVIIRPDQNYQEIGVYCFGKGIFHKSPRTGIEVGVKDLYEIHAGDFILQITFAWEGAVALAESCDHGLFGSVRYLTFRVNEEICSARYLLTYMKTSEAINQLGRISPGSAGRNRVLSVKRLKEVIVPVVPLTAQAWLTDGLTAQVERLKRMQTETATELDALMPSLLSNAFKGEL